MKLRLIANMSINTGKVIVEEFKNRGISPEECPAILIHRHGPFTWGKNPFKAVENALILEEVITMHHGNGLTCWGCHHINFLINP